MVDRRDDELDGMRIRKLSGLRRSTSRSRSYAVIGACATLVCAAQLVWLTVGDVMSTGWIRRDFGFIAGMILALYATKLLAARALAFHKEMKTPMLTDPQTTPDFSRLSNGSQYAANLEAMSGSSSSREDES
jgi:hypothetical protein